MGVGRLDDPYAATLRALEACTEWPPPGVEGARVIVKPNLVVAATAETGAVTDPQVVRAVVDRALAAGAREVWVAEGALGGGHFDACGYGFFRSYDPLGRVALVNLDELPETLVDAWGGLTYRQIYLPAVLMESDTVLISVAKMKTHVETLVTLSMKNLFGLPPLQRYRATDVNARFAMHFRGVNEAIADQWLARPADFAVIDGIWGMEGRGPLGGRRVKMDTVIAGRNGLAVDWIGTEAMGVPIYRVQHLMYAIGMGFGPTARSQIDVLGDPLSPRAFDLPQIPPVIDRPQADPPVIVPARGETMEIRFWLNRPCAARVEIVSANDYEPEMTPVRLLQDWTAVDLGWHTLTWDGMDDSGARLPVGEYFVHVEATGGEESANHAHATTRVSIAPILLVQRAWLPLVRH
ncbi:MAG: hypothetical protein Kow0047_03240 [Anaerolineae bacterium]